MTVELDRLRLVEPAAKEPPEKQSPIADVRLECPFCREQEVLRKQDSFQCRHCAAHLELGNVLVAIHGNRPRDVSAAAGAILNWYRYSLFFMIVAVITVIGAAVTTAWTGVQMMDRLGILEHIGIKSCK